MKKINKELVQEMDNLLRKLLGSYEYLDTELAKGSPDRFIKMKINARNDFRDKIYKKWEKIKDKGEVK